MSNYQLFVGVANFLSAILSIIVAIVAKGARAKQIKFKFNRFIYNL